MKNGDDYELFDLSMNRLPEYWLEQSGLYHKYAVKLADAKKSLGEAKAAKAVSEEELKDVAAKIDRDIRRDPTDFGFSADKKPTEGAIENAIRLDDRFVKARDQVFKDDTNAVIEAQHLVDVLYATVYSLDQRKESLQDLVKLEGRDQFAQPRVKDHEGGAKLRENEVKTAFNRKGKNK